jgi:phosphate transport system permease protein
MSNPSLAADEGTGALLARSPLFPTDSNLEISPARRKARAIGQRVLSYGTMLTAVIPMLGLGAMLVILLVEAIPAIRYNGWHFLTGSAWNPGNTYGALQNSGGALHAPGASFGAWPLIAGTLESSAIALILALPIAVGAAILLVERLPARAAGVIGWFLEILAGVPSVVIGLWGVFTFGPWLAHEVYPWLSHVPWIFHGQYNSNGEGLLTGGFVLAAMIIPIIAATTRDLLRQVPETTKEGAEALGMTGFEVFRTVTARWVRTGIIGAAVLGLGRALGETIAIALVSGSANYLAHNIYSPMTTIAATIVNQLDAAQSDPSGFAVKTLAEAALVLLLITFLVNVIARVIVKRAARGAALPLGAGF